MASVAGQGVEGNSGRTVTSSWCACGLPGYNTCSLKSLEPFGPGQTEHWSPLGAEFLTMGLTSHEGECGYILNSAGEH